MVTVISKKWAGWTTKPLSTLQLRQKSLPQAQDRCKICMLNSQQQSFCKWGTHEALAVTGNNIAATVISNLNWNINRITTHDFWYNVNVRQCMFIFYCNSSSFTLPNTSLLLQAAEVLRTVKLSFSC